MTSTLKLKPYQRVVVASGVSNVADGIRLVALPLLALAVTESPLFVSATIAASLAPWLVFGLWAGRLTDRSDRKLLAQRTALLRVVLLSLLAVLIVVGVVPIPLLLIAAFVLGLSEVLADNVNGTLIPSLVPEENLEHANSRMVAGEILGNELIGPAVGGLLFAAAAALPFFTNAGLLAISYLLLAGLPLLNRFSIDAGYDFSEPRARDGIEILRSSPLLLTILWSSGLLAAIDGAWFALLALMVTVEMGLSSAALGLFLAVGALGGLIGAAVSRRFDATPLERVAAAIFASMAIPLLTLSMFPNTIMLGIALIATSGAFSLWNVVMVSARQRASPPEALGRVGAAYRTFVVACALVGTLAGGLLAQLASITVTLAVSAIGLCAAIPLVLRGFRAA